MIEQLKILINKGLLSKQTEKKVEQAITEFKERIKSELSKIERKN